MNKKEFTKNLKSELLDLPINKKIETLEKISKNWIPELLEDVKKNYEYCSKCNKYSLIKDFTTENETKIFNETTFSDCGYGDDDEIGEVQYYMTYSICPICKHKKVKNKQYLTTLSSRRRK